MNRATWVLVVAALSVAFRASSAAAGAATFSAPPAIAAPQVGGAAVGARGEAAPAPSDLWYEHFDASPLGVRPDLSWFTGDVSDWGVWTEYAPDCGVEITPGRSMRVWAHPHGTSGTQPSVANPLLTVGGSPVVLSEGLRFFFTATSTSEWNPDGNYGGAYARFYAGPASDPLQGAGIYYIVDGHGSFPAYPVLDPYRLINVGSSGRFYCDLWQDFQDLVGYSPTGWVLWNLEILVSGGRDDTSVEVVFDDLVLTTGGIFSDVSLSFWARHEIEACAEQGVVSGYPDGTYQPGVSVTRDQMAVYVARAVAGGDGSVPDPGCSAPPFTDVDCSNWARKYIQFCVAEGIVKGYEDGSYQPGLEVTRDQMAVYIARAIVEPTCRAELGCYTPPSTPTFPDVPTDHWAFKHIEYCAQEDVVKGYEDGYYHPERVVTRDQMAVYVARAFGLMS
jgi:hypothetical protein